MKDNDLCGTESPSRLSERSLDSGFSDLDGVKVKPKSKRWRKTNENSSNRVWENLPAVNGKFQEEEIPRPVCTSTPNANLRRNPRPKNTPVVYWLREVRLTCEPECMSTLQSKSLTSNLSKQISVLIAVTSSLISILNKQSILLSSEFENLFSLIRCGQFSEIVRRENNLFKCINELLDEYFVNESRLSYKKNELKGVFSSLKKALKMKDIKKAESAATTLASTFKQRIELLLLLQIERLVSVLEKSSSLSSVMCALSGITELGLKASHLSDLLTRCSGIMSMLNLCSSNPSASIRSAALRILAIVCCTQSSITQFEKGGGLKVICDILSDEERGEPEKCEAASVIAQVTAPWLEDGCRALRLNEHLSPLISSLTSLIKEVTSCEMLLLSTSALANISSTEPESAGYFMEFDTVGPLLKAVRSQGPCVFLKEQAATILANMSALAEVRPHLAYHKAVPALLCFLEVSDSPLKLPAELRAAYRLQHKAAIALSRLCNEPGVVHQIIQLNGISSLARLCRDEQEIKHSDKLLRASLVALRKVVTNNGVLC